jgi:hypothetical protein
VAGLFVSHVQKNNQVNHMAQVGGARPGAGRKPGKVGKAKRELSAMAKDHAEAALRTLVEIASNKEEQASARVSAANALLDRGYGRPAQSVALSNPDGSLAPQPSTIIIEAATDDDSDDQTAAKAGEALQ